MWWTEEDFRKTTRFDRFLFFSLLFTNLFIYCTSASYFLQSFPVVTDNSLPKLTLCSMIIAACVAEAHFLLDRALISKVLIKVDKLNWQNLRRSDSIKYRDCRNRIYLEILGLLLLLTILIIGIYIAILWDVWICEDVYFKNSFSTSKSRLWIKIQNLIVAMFFPWFTIFVLLSFVMITEIFIRISFYYRVLAEDVEIVGAVEDERVCLDKMRSLFSTFNELEW